MAKTNYFGIALFVVASAVWAHAVPAEQAPSDPQAEGDACGISISAKAQPLAMVALTITSRCLPDEQIILHHSGLMFSHKTDAAGIAKMAVPALSAKAIFVATFDNGDGALTMIDVPDADQFQRVALQWQGTKGLQLHAYEAGAGYGSDSQLSLQTAPLDLGSTKANDRFFTKLGTADIADGFHAQVASFPSKDSGETQAIVLTVEAEITDENCGRTVVGEILRRNADNRSNGQQLTLYLPKCDAVGNFIVMGKILEKLEFSVE